MSPRNLSRHSRPETFQNIREMLLAGERDFFQTSQFIRGVEASAKGIERLRSISLNKRQNNIDSAAVDALIENSEEKFQRSLRALETEASPSEEVLDFRAWALELQLASTYHEPSITRYNSEESENVLENATRFAIRNPTASPHEIILPSPKKMVQKMPMRMHANETRKYFEDEGGRKEEWFTSFSLAAWSIAIGCMMLALGFLTKEFLTSQRNPAIRVEQIPSNEIELPAISICSPNEGLPSFENYPRPEYPGHPLFLIAAISNGHDDTVGAAHYPDTIGSDLIEPIFRGPSAAKCRQVLSKMSIERSRRALFRFKPERNQTLIGLSSDEEPCQKCFRVGFKRRLNVHRLGSRSSTKMPVTISVASSSVFGLCNLLTARQKGVALLAFVKLEIENHLRNLEEKDILTFKNSSLNSQEKIESIRSFQMNKDAFNLMLCNVYFFAGHFYPSVDVGTVKFEWDETAKVWSPKGKFYTWNTESAGETPQYSFQDGRSSNAFASPGVELFYEDQNEIAKRPEKAVVGRLAADSFVAGPSISRIYFTRVQRKGEIIFNTDSGTAQIEDGLATTERYVRVTLGMLDFAQFR